jgi:hypothetical protein
MASEITSVGSCSYIWANGSWFRETPLPSLWWYVSVEMRQGAMSIYEERVSSSCYAIFGAKYLDCNVTRVPYRDVQICNLSHLDSRWYDMLEELWGSDIPIHSRLRVWTSASRLLWLNSKRDAQSKLWRYRLWWGRSEPVIWRHYFADLSIHLHIYACSSNHPVQFLAHRVLSQYAVVSRFTSRYW